MIQAEIQGSSHNNGRATAEVYNPIPDGRSGQPGMTVYTRLRDNPESKFLPFLNSDFGAALNQNGSFGGTPIGIHDGTDTVEWTGSNIIGTKATFDSTDTGTGWPPVGTKSVKIDNPNAGDVWEFDKGSNQALTGYTAITMKIYIDKDWTLGDSVSIYGWDGAIVGNKVLLEDYISEFDFDVAQTASIPLSDFGLVGGTITGLRMQQESKNGKAALLYIDEIQIEETGEPISFRVTHTGNTVYQADKLIITFIDAYAGTLVSGAGMIPISYDKILNLNTLTTGFTLTRVSDGEIKFQGNITNIGDMISLGFDITNAGSDGTNSFISLSQDFKNPLTIEGSPQLNFIAITINDNMTGLLKFTAAFRGSEITIG